MSATRDERRRRAMIDAVCTCTCPACGHVGPWHGECQSCGHDSHNPPAVMPTLGYRITAPDDVLHVCPTCASSEPERDPGSPLSLHELEEGPAVLCDGCGSTIYGGDA